MRTGGRRAAFKVAYRNAVRNRKRTFYLVALVAVPVAAAVVVGGFVRANSFTFQEEAHLRFGTADFAITTGGADREQAVLERGNEPGPPLHRAQSLSRRSRS